MKPPSPQLMAIYERCLIGSLLACEVTVRELDVTAADFSDPKAQRAFSAVAEVAEESTLSYPTAIEMVEAVVPAHHVALVEYIREAYADFATRHLALDYAKLIAKRGKERTHRAAIAARIAGRSAA